jgi:hypothetical protein
MMKRRKSRKKIARKMKNQKSLNKNLKRIIII